MTRAAVSVPSNIAEGYERDTNAEFIRFLNIAKGSAAELRTQVYIAKEVGVIDSEAMTDLIAECREISAMLNGLVKSRQSRVKESPQIPQDSKDPKEPGLPET